MRRLPPSSDTPFVPFHAMTADNGGVKEKAYTQCGEVKPLEAFGWSNAGRSRTRRPRPACKACRVKAEKARYRTDPGPNKARAAAWYAANPERVKANARVSAAADPERRRRWKKKYEAANPEKVRANVQRYRTRIRRR
jgi:hypothetical protein